MNRQAMIALCAALVVVAPAEAGVGKRLMKSAGRVAGKAVVHAQQAEATAQNADQPTQAAAPQVEGAAPRSVAGITAIAPGTTSQADAAPAVATQPVATQAGVEDRAPALTVDAFGDSVEALPASLRENSYFYSSFGTQDPFRSLLAGDFTPKLQQLVDMHTVQLVGVIWEPDEVAAMVQDAQGFGYTLRPGDAVKNGSVVAVRQDALVARLNIFGQTTQVTLRLQRDEE